MWAPVRLLTGLYIRNRSRRWNRRKIEAHRRKRLIALLSYVRKHSPYYRDILQGVDVPSLDRVPIIDKSGMRLHYNRINTAGLVWDDLVEFAINRERTGAMDLFRGEYSLGLSSGTSGNKMVTVLSSRERERYGALLWARGGIYFRGPKRILFALRVNNPSFMEVRKFGLTIIYVDYTHDVTDLVTIINNDALNVVAGPPSLLMMLADRVGEITSPIRTLVSYAEVLMPDHKDHLRRIFGCPVVQIYQGAEGFLGFTCEQGTMHLNEDIVHVELLDAGDPEGRIKRVVVTDLYRRTLPFIRYALNDLLEIDEAPCPCGSSFRRIVRIHGRQDDLFLVKDDRGNRRYLFPDYVRRSITQASDAVLDYQAIQESEELITIRLVLPEELVRESVEDAIRENLWYWTNRIGAILPRLDFVYAQAQRHPESKKVIRIWRRFG